MSESQSSTPSSTPPTPPSPWPTGLLSTSSGAPVLKVLLILAMVIGFLLPLALVRDAIQERNSRQQSVAGEIGQIWGNRQTVMGPILIVPYRETFINAREEIFHRERTAFFLPDRYDVGAEVRSETRHRGIFEAVVYTTDILLAGEFALPPVADWAPDEAEILWERAAVIVGANDLRSIDGVMTIDWDGETLPLRPGAPALGELVSGRMSAAIPDLAALGTRTIPFETRLTLNGSDSLDFAPLGRETHVSIKSNWQDPGFVGAFLPDRHTVSEAGFDADWTVSYYGRPYPQHWNSAEENDILPAIRGSDFGVRFVQPVSAYLQSERSAKHGVLFIIFTFAVFFLFETVAGLRIHVFQYGLVGMSLCLFYLLLISVAEHLGFAAAYGIGAAAVVGQIVLYTAKVLASARRSAAIGALLTALYGGLFVLMGLEDFALLFGSVALFAALGAVMFVTRNIDWYAIKRPAAESAGVASAH